MSAVVTATRKGKSLQPIHFHFDFRKTLQAAGVLARREPGQMISRMRLLKLLYIAERETLRDRGRLISGDSLAALPHGPILSEFYNVIKGESPHSPMFEGYFTAIGYRLKLVKKLGVGSLNRYEVRKLREISERYKDTDDETLRDETHEFLEWKKHNPGKSSEHIPIEDVLAAVERTDQTERVRRNAELRAGITELWD